MDKNTIVLPTADGVMHAYFVKPDKETKTAVIVLQEAFGVNSHIKDVCLRLQREGYMAIAPELYHRFGNNVVYDYNDPKDMMMTYRQLTNAMIEMDIAAAIHYLTENERVEKKHIAVIGFCMGGFAALLAACRFQLGMAFSFYGAGVVKKRPDLGIASFVNEVSNIRMPVLCFFGEEDKNIPPEDVEAVRAALGKQTKYPFEVIVYPQAGHGFFCEERASFNADAAKDAWGRVLGWLGKLT